MAASSRGYKQDMPPRGGFGDIDWAKSVRKPRFGGFAKFGMFIGFTGASWLVFAHFEKIRRKEEIELIESRIAVLPLIQAEKNRLFLLQLRKNRDEENELMKDVPGWITGTYYGEPVFYNVNDRFINPACETYFAHCSWYDLYKATHDKLFH